METHLIVGVLSPLSESRALSSSDGAFARGLADLLIDSMEWTLSLEEPSMSVRLKVPWRDSRPRFDLKISQHFSGDALKGTTGNLGGEDSDKYTLAEAISRAVDKLSLNAWSGAVSIPCISRLLHTWGGVELRWNRD
jgi:hypothetical protein